MKTAISISDDTLRSVTRAAKRLRVSRSEFFARAAKCYLKQVDKSALTQRINAVLDKIGPTPLDPVQARHAKKMMLKVEWR
ncbi:MAG TPA: CopG family transcriptional regulator [Planctomycetota bacterium]|nr:CopG family transcriptional regulator [Planctomycetota bacterium]